MPIKPLFQGSAVALATPFLNGEVDVPALHRLVDFQIDSGTAALVACGTTGEPTTMTPQEREQVVKETIKAAKGRVPVIAGTGSNWTQNVIDTANRYTDIGCAAQLVVTPYYNKTTQEGLYRHYMEIAEKTSLPILIYNVPSRTNLDIAPETLGRLASSDKFIGLKESSYNLPFVMEKLRVLDGRLTLYSGNDDMVQPLMALGAAGVISVVANILPKAMAHMAESYLSGNNEEALSAQLRLLPLVRAMFAEVSPIPCKAAMEWMGLCSGELRLPLVPIGEAAKAQLRAALEQAGVEFQG